MLRSAWPRQGSAPRNKTDLRVVNAKAGTQTREPGEIRIFTPLADMTVLVEVDSLTDYPPIPSIETGKRRTVAHVFCPVVKRRHVNDPNGWPVDHLVAKARKARDPIVDNQPRCCANTSSVTVPVRIPVEEAQDSTTPLAKAMKHVQDGPSIYTKEWNEVHGRRNSVESVNGTLKGSLGAFIDDPRTRLMRV